MLSLFSLNKYLSQQFAQTAHVTMVVFYTLHLMRGKGFMWSKIEGGDIHINQGLCFLILSIRWILLCEWVRCMISECTVRSTWDLHLVKDKGSR